MIHIITRGNKAEVTISYEQGYEVSEENGNLRLDQKGNVVDVVLVELAEES